MRIIGLDRVELLLNAGLPPSHAGQLRSLICEFEANEWKSPDALKHSFPGLDVSNDPYFDFLLCGATLRLQTRVSFTTQLIMVLSATKVTKKQTKTKGREAA